MALQDPLTAGQVDYPSPARAPVSGCFCDKKLNNYNDIMESNLSNWIRLIQIAFLRISGSDRSINIQ